MLDVYFPEGSGIKIISEPGSYFVSSAFTLAVNIVAKKVVENDKFSSGGKLKVYSFLLVNPISLKMSSSDTITCKYNFGHLMAYDIMGILHPSVGRS